MVDSCVCQLVGDPTNYRKCLSVVGDDTVITLQAQGQEPMEFRADPSHSRGPAFWLVNEGVDALESFIDEMCEDSVCGGQVSRKSIQEMAIHLLRRIRNREVQATQLVPEIKKLLRELKGKVVRYESFVPVDNLIIDGVDHVAVGQVRFEPMASALARLQEPMTDVIDGTASPENDKANMKQVLRDAIIPQLYATAPTCASVEVTGEGDRVHQIANVQVDASLNLLRCFTHAFFPLDHRAFIGLRGSVVEAKQPCLSMSLESAFVFNVQSVGAFFPYVLDASKIEWLRINCSFDELSSILSIDDGARSPVERNIVAAIRWLGRSIITADYPERVLFIVIALERLLLGESSAGEKSETIAQRAAVLIADTAEQRKEIHSRTKKLYGLRSDVVHMGKAEINADAALELEVYTRAAIIRMAGRRSEWRSQADFVNWVQEQLFSTIPVAPA
jgi:hypothetical protein